MKSSRTSHRVIVSGGGTGGHIYPAIAIADEIKRRMPDAEIMFVGALGKMEMEKVPKAGYPIKGLPITGFDRGNLLSNFGLPFKLIKSLLGAGKIIKEFKPDVAIGTGGYASGPLLWKAAGAGVPVVIQEQNSFPGVTNKLLKNKASAICVAYDSITQFPKEKQHHTGNPIRAELFQNLPAKDEAVKFFGLDPAKKVILSVGGSLGSRTLNNSWKAGLDKIQNEDIQLIWQTGQLEYEKIKNEVPEDVKGVKITEFIYDMKMAYAAADVIVSRAGAMAISELELIAKPIILVPFPFASEDHQTKNAGALVNKNAALMLSDAEAVEKLADMTLDLMKDDKKAKTMAENLKKLGKPNATKEITDIITGLLK